MTNDHNPKDAVDDPADAFEYDECGCLVALTPEAFNFFMFRPALPTRVVEAQRHLQRLSDDFQTAAVDPAVEHERQGVREMLAGSQARLAGPVSELALMRLTSKCNRAISRYRFNRE